MIRGWIRQDGMGREGVLSFRTREGSLRSIPLEWIRRARLFPDLQFSSARRTLRRLDLEAGARGLLKDLDHRSGRIRQEAERKLIAMGRPVRHLVRKVGLFGSPEARMRAQRILRRLHALRDQGSWE